MTHVVRFSLSLLSKRNDEKFHFSILQKTAADMTISRRRTWSYVERNIRKAQINAQTADIFRTSQVENEDELPVSFDFHQLVGLKEGERRAFLESMLQACSSEAMPAFIDKCLERISKLDARVSDTISVTGPTNTFATEQHR